MRYYRYILLVVIIIIIATVLGWVNKSHSPQSNNNIQPARINTNINNR